MTHPNSRNNRTDIKQKQTLSFIQTHSYMKLKPGKYIKTKCKSHMM